MIRRTMNKIPITSASGLTKAQCAKANYLRIQRHQQPNVCVAYGLGLIAWSDIERLAPKSRDKACQLLIRHHRPFTSLKHLPPKTSGSLITLHDVRQNFVVRFPREKKTPGQRAPKSKSQDVWGQLSEGGYRPYRN
jgi:hypothetical protein